MPGLHTGAPGASSRAGRESFCPSRLGCGGRPAQPGGQGGVGGYISSWRLQVTRLETGDRVVSIDREGERRLEVIFFSACRCRDEVSEFWVTLQCCVRSFSAHALSSSGKWNVKTLPQDLTSVMAFHSRSSRGHGGGSCFEATPFSFLVWFARAPPFWGPGALRKDEARLHWSQLTHKRGCGTPKRRYGPSAYGLARICVVVFSSGHRGPLPACLGRNRWIHLV